MFRNIPYYANVQGLGTAFQKKGLSQLVTLLYKVAFFRVKKVFFENKRNAEEFTRRHIVNSKKQKILHGAGINLNYYGYEPYPFHETIHFLYLGRIMKEKGMDELLSAVNRLREEGENFVLDIVGFFEDAYEKQISELEQKNIAVFYGFQENPQPYYATADCVVLPSYHEGMSNVLLEAAATGRPLITTNIPGCREVVEQGKTGILVQARSSESLYIGMKKFLRLSHRKREIMGKLGREKMEKEFRKEEVVEETMRAMGL